MEALKKFQFLRKFFGFKQIIDSLALLFLLIHIGLNFNEKCLNSCANHENLDLSSLFFLNWMHMTKKDFLKLFHILLPQPIYIYIYIAIKRLCIIIITYQITSELIYIIIIIKSCRQYGYPWPSLATSPSRSSPPVGFQGYILYPHIAAECMFELVVLLLPGHMCGSIFVHIFIYFREWVSIC